MRSTRFLPSFLLPLAFLASCTDSDSLTTPDDASVPAFKPGKAPPTSGPNVVRGLPLGFIIGPDPQSGLVLEAGFETPITALNCADFLNTSVLSLTQQRVTTPSGRIHFTTVPQEVSVDVSLVGGSLTEVCQLVGAPLIATGTATFAATESYVADGGHGASTINITVQGILELTGGGRVRVLGAVHLIVRPDGSLLRDTETITLTPI